MPRSAATTRADGLPSTSTSAAAAAVLATAWWLTTILLLASRSPATTVSAWSGGGIVVVSPRRRRQRERPRSFSSSISLSSSSSSSSSSFRDDGDRKVSASSSAAAKRPSSTATTTENDGGTKKKSGGGRTNAKRDGRSRRRDPQRRPGNDRNRRRNDDDRHPPSSRRKQQQQRQLPPPAETVSGLVRNLRTIMSTKVKASGGRGKGRVRSDWRTAWSILKAEATIPAREAASCDDDDDDGNHHHTTVLPVSVYHDVLKRMESEPGCWQDAVRLVRYMGTGGDSAGDTTTTTTTTRKPSDAVAVVDKYNSRPWHVPAPTYEIYHTLLECLSRNGGGRRDAHDASVYWLSATLRKLEADLAEEERRKRDDEKEEDADDDADDDSVSGVVVVTNRDRKLVRNSLQLVLGSLSKQRKWREALRLLEYAEILAERGDIALTVVQYNTVLTCLARCNQVGQCRRLLQRLQVRSKELLREEQLRKRSSPYSADDYDDDSSFQRRKILQPDEISYNAVIGACASAGRTKDALRVLDECYREPGVEPNIYIYTNAMRACAKGGSTQRALSLLQVVKDKALPVDSYCYTAVIDACAKGKQWKKALELFDEMVEQGIEPTQVTYSATISALGNGLQWERALWLLNLMRDQEGMKVNLITYNAAITALAKSSKNKHSAKLSNNGAAAADGDDDDADEEEQLWPKALALLKQMDEDGIEPDGFCYSSAINCCGAEGRWEEACSLIETMKRGGPNSRPNKVAYTAAISACGRAGQGAKALELFQNMRDDGLAADRVAYNALFSALRVSKDADRAYELWGEICGRRRSSSSAIARGDAASPDIITLTDCIATLSRAGYTERMDEVFREAVDRGIVLGRNNDLDEQWEIDLSGMPFPVARAAARYLLGAIRRGGESRDDVEDDDCDYDHDGDRVLQDMVFITGIGKAQQKRRREKSKSRSSSKRWQQRDSNGGGGGGGGVLERKDRTTSLRDFLRGILETDFDPPLASVVPERARGTVVIEEEALRRWLDDRGRVVVVAATADDDQDENEGSP